MKASVQNASRASIQEPIANDVTAHIDRFPGVSFCNPLQKVYQCGSSLTFRISA